MGCASHLILRTGSSDKSCGRLSCVQPADQWRTTQFLFAFGRLVLMGEDLDWWAELTHRGAASSSHLVPGTQQDMRLAGGGGEQDCPSVLITQLGKVLLFPHCRAFLTRTVWWFCFDNQYLWRGADICEDLLVNICIASVTGLQCVLALSECGWPAEDKRPSFYFPSNCFC